MDNIKITKNNDDGMKAILKGTSYAINQAFKDAPYDRTYIGLVTAINLETNTYSVKIDEHVYTNIVSMIKTDVNHTVVVMCPQNQLSQMFIYGEIDITDYISEGGEGEAPISIDLIRINMATNGSDIVTIDSNKHYYIYDTRYDKQGVRTLQIVLNENNVSGNYFFSFISGNPASQLILSNTILIPSSLTMDVDTYYEMYINPYTNVMTYTSQNVD